jgi:PAS domain S-box-containing protein
LEAVAGAYLVCALFEFKPTFQRVQDVIGFAVFAVFVSAMFAATLGVIGLYVADVTPLADLGRAWRAWWLGDAMGILLLTPLLLVWLSSPFDLGSSKWRLLEWIALLSLLVCAGTVVHGGVVQEKLSHPIVFASAPLMIWAALRFKEHGAVTAAFIVVVLAALGTLQGRGPFILSSMNMTLVYLYGYSITMTLTGMLLGAAIAERRAAEIGLRRLSHELEGRVAERTAALQDELRERTRAQEAFRESESRFRAIFEQSGIGMAIMDRSGTLLQTNLALQEILGYTPADLSAMRLAAVTHPDDFGDEIELLNGATASRASPAYTAEKRYVRKDGGIVWAKLTATVIRDSTGAVLYGVGMIEDITQRVLAEKEREQLLCEIREALARVKTLSGLLPICSACKKIRDDQGYWTQVERYLMDHTDAQFSHGICPDCMKALYPEFADKAPTPNTQQAPRESPSTF